MVDFSFLKSHRLLNKSDFQYLRKDASFLRFRSFHCFYKNSNTTSRLGLSVSKKVGNAVKRNRIKRVFREEFRLNRSFLPPNHILIIANRSLSGLDNGDYEDLIRGDFLKFKDQLIKSRQSDSTVV